MSKIKTFNTDYGKVSLYNNEIYIIEPFNKGSYWDIETLLKLKNYINPNKNILEIGGHCGTSTLVYASFLNPGYKVFVYEPQKKMYDLLVKNIEQNNLQDKIEAFNLAVFCDNISLTMNDTDLDGGGGIVADRYNDNNSCNFGGLCLGKNGEKVNAIIMDDMKHENIGYIHCDAQGAENFIFSKGTELLKRDKPVILFENNAKYAKYLYNNVKNSYPQYNEFANFNLIKYCIGDLKYSKILLKFANADDLLIP